MKKNILLQILILFAGLWVLLGHASASGNRQTSEGENSAVITDIYVENDSVVIKSNKNFTYTISRATDPYKSAIEIPGMSVGPFNRKIVVDKAGVVEIVPQQMDSPRRGARIEVVLQSPSQLSPVYGNNSLALLIAKESPVVLAGLIKDDRQPVAVPYEVAVEDGPVARVIPASSESIQPQVKATEVKRIEVQKNANAVKVVITGNGSMVPNVFPVNERIVVDIPDVSLHASLPEKMISPIRGIRVGKHKDKLRLVLDVREKTNFDVNSSGNTVEISLISQGGAEAFAAPSNSDKEKEVVVSIAPIKPSPSSPEYEPLIEGEFTGRKISLDFQDADIIPIFRLLGDVSGYNIVLNPEVKGKVTLKLINVPWDQALDIIMRTFSLAKIVDGNIIRIVPIAAVAKELDQHTKEKKAKDEAGDLRTKIFSVNYADLSKLKDAIDKAKVLSSRGSISQDDRGSTFIVNDIEANLQKIQELIAEIDRPDMQARQVMIEARIVEVNRDFSNELGIQWGVNSVKPNATGTTIIGGPAQTQGQGFSGNNYLVNLPAAIAAGSGGAIGLGYISKTANFALDVQLSALEQMNKAKVISSPRVMTLNNESANIKQGRTLQLPSTDDQGKTKLLSVDILLFLDVKPRITPSGAIQMTIKITKDELVQLIQTGSATGAETTKNEVNTSVLIDNGDTIVIGGIFKRDERKSEDGVPGLSKIPFLGRLFKKTGDAESTSELIVFITPRIVEFGSMK